MFPKAAAALFCLKVVFFNAAQKVLKYLGYFCKQLCCQELSISAQSGHFDQKPSITFGTAFLSIISR